MSLRLEGDRPIADQLARVEGFIAARGGAS
jgi:hypothetical protein